MNEIELSIIIPFYNEENFILSNLNSIAKQNYLEFIELILVSDGSTDNSVNIIESFKKKHDQLNLKLLKVNKTGVGNCRNIGIENSTGNFILFLDADDYLSDNFTFEIFKHLDQNIDAIMYGFNQVNFDGQISKYFDSYRFPLENPTKNQIIDLFIKNEIQLWTSNIIYSKAFIKKFGIAFMNYIRGQDINFILKALIKINKIVFIKKELIFYRLHNKEVSKINNIKRFDAFYSYLDIIENLDKESVKNKALSNFIIRLALKYYLIHNSNLNISKLINKKDINETYPNIRLDYRNTLKRLNFLEGLIYRFYFFLSDSLLNSIFNLFLKRY